MNTHYTVVFIRIMAMAALAMATHHATRHQWLRIADNGIKNAIESCFDVKILMNLVLS